MTIFEPGQVGNPDWQRVSQFQGAVLLDGSPLVVPVGHFTPRVYVGDAPSLGVLCPIVHGSTGWSVTFQWESEPPGYATVAQQVYEGVADCAVFDVIGNVAPFLTVGLHNYGGGPAATFSPTVWKSQAYPGTSAPLPRPIGIEQLGITVAHGAPQTFYSSIVSREQWRAFLRGTAGPDSLLELGVVDHAGVITPIGQTELVDPYGHALFQQTLSLSTFQPVVTMTCTAAGPVTMDASLVLV